MRKPSRARLDFLRRPVSRPLTRSGVGRSISWVLIGSVAAGAAQWGCIVALGHFASPTEIGELSLGYAVSAPFAMASNGQLRQILASDVGSGASFGDYFSLRLAAATVAVSATLLVGWAMGLSHVGFAALVFVAAAKWAEALSEICYGLDQAADHSVAMGRAMVVRALVATAAGAALAASVRTAWATAAGIAVASVVVFTAYDRPRTARLLLMVSSMPLRGSLAGPFVVWRGAQMRRLLASAIPLGLAAGLGAITWNLPRYFLQWYCGSHDQGVFSALAVLPLAGSTVPAAIAVVVGPRLAEMRSRGQTKSFSRTLAKAAVAGGLLALGGAVLARSAGAELLGLTLGPAFREFAPLLSFLFVASLPQYVLFAMNAGFIASGQYGAQLRALLPTALVGCLAGLLLVPRYGVGGAVAMYGIAGLVQCMVSASLAFGMSKKHP